MYRNNQYWKMPYKEIHDLVRITGSVLTFNYNASILERKTCTWQEQSLVK